MRAWMCTTALAGALAGALTLAAGAVAQDQTHERCLTLSFAPLDDNIPACTALIESSGALDPPVLGAIYAARAEAYEFALTYHGDHDVSAEALLAAALADLDRAVAIDPRHHAQRADILYRLSRFEEAAAGFTAAIAADPSAAAARLESRSAALEASGDLTGAIEDVTAAIRLAASTSDAARLTLRRAELREAAGERAAALADYERVLRDDRENVTARNGADRLAGAER